MSKTNTFKFQGIEPGSLVSIEISGAFHKRILGAYLTFTAQFEEVKLRELLDIIATDGISKMPDGASKWAGNSTKDSLKTKLDNFSTMEDYVHDTHTCRKRQILKYFGEKVPKDYRCGDMCDTCLKLSKKNSK